jgi:Legionella pneumophila major outer membrane protein precursor
MPDRNCRRLMATLLASSLAFGFGLGSATGQPPPGVPPIQVPAAPPTLAPAPPDNVPGLGAPQPYVAPPVLAPAPPPAAPYPPLTAPMPLSPPPGALVVPPGGSPFVAPPPGGYSTSILDGTFFFGIDAAFVQPHVTNGLHTTVPRLNGTSVNLTPPASPLDWTVSPTFTLGYKLPQNQGEFRLAYRYEATEGTDAVVTPGGNFAVKSRLNDNIIDLEYGSARAPIFGDDKCPTLWNIKWYLGLRVDSSFYDTVVSNATMVDRVSNNFIGAGPRGGVELERQFAVLPSFYLFGRANASVLVGQIDQKFSETFPAAPGSLLTANLERNSTQSVPEVDVQIGLKWVVPGAEYLQFSVGYQAERWWSMGRSSMLGTRLNLSEQGVFLRGEIEF